MKIINLKAENIKRLVAVEITPDGNMVEITGKNGQGKTSVLDSIWWALAGKSSIQDAPIRNGETEAKIKLDLGEIKVTRTFTKLKNESITTSIFVENGDGARVESPQTLLDSFLGHLSFDPLEFCRMRERDQFNTLAKFVDFDFEDLEKANKEDYDIRTGINRRMHEALAAAEKIAIPFEPPAEHIDETAIVDELEKAGQHNTEIETRKGNRNALADELKRNMDINQSLAEELMELEEAIKLCKDKIERVKNKIRVDEETLTSAPPLPEPIDTTGIKERLKKARENNAILDQWEAERKKKADFETEARSLKEESDTITLRMNDRLKKKQTAIANSQMPVKEIEFGDNRILLNGVPFDQASDAEKLQVSIAIAMANNPELKVVRVRDGSLLDDDSMKLLSKMAKEKDFQVWIERVDSSGAVGFVIEDGHLKQ